MRITMRRFLAVRGTSVARPAPGFQGSALRLVVSYPDWQRGTELRQMSASCIGAPTENCRIWA